MYFLRIKVGTAEVYYILPSRYVSWKIRSRKGMVFLKIHLNLQSFI